MHLTGMASATTNMFRDLGFALGPVIVGAVALSHAGSSYFSALPRAGLVAAALTVTGMLRTRAVAPAPGSLSDPIHDAAPAAAPWVLCGESVATTTDSPQTPESAAPAAG